MESMMMRSKCTTREPAAPMLLPRGGRSRPRRRGHLHRLICEHNFAAAARENADRFWVDPLQRFVHVGFLQEKINAVEAVPQAHERFVILKNLRRIGKERSEPQIRFSPVQHMDWNAGIEVQ